MLLLSPAQGYGANPARAAEVQQQRLQALAEKGVAGLAATVSARLLSAQASAAHHAQVQQVAQRLTPGGYAQAVQMLCNSDLATLAALCGLPQNPSNKVSVPNWFIACAIPAAVIRMCWTPPC